MKSRKSIPTFDLYKNISNPLHFEFFRLEKSYNSYNARLPHRHNYFEILYFEKSGGSHFIDFVKYPIEASSIHFISPEQVHQLRRKGHVKGYVISFAVDFFLNNAINSEFIELLPFFNDSDVIPVVRLNEMKEKNEIKKLIRSMNIEFNSSRNDRMDLIASLLLQLLLLSRRIHQNNAVKLPGNSQRSGIYKKYKELVKKYFRDHKSVSVYSQMMKITPGHLNDTLQKETGKSASEILYSRIILEAKRLLYHSSLSIKEIAADLKYDDPSHFSRFFKNHTGKTPDEFRTTIRELSH